MKRSYTTLLLTALCSAALLTGCHGPHHGPDDRPDGTPNHDGQATLPSESETGGVTFTIKTISGSETTISMDNAQGNAVITFSGQGGMMPPELVPTHTDYSLARHSSDEAHLKLTLPRQEQSAELCGIPEGTTVTVVLNAWGEATALEIDIPAGESMLWPGTEPEPMRRHEVATLFDELFTGQLHVSYAGEDSDRGNGGRPGGRPESRND